MNLTQEDLKALSGRFESPAVSIYIPTHRAGADTRENPIRFQNGVREAQRLLEARGIDPKAAQEMLEPAQRLVDDNDFWQHQQDGFAMFLAEGTEQSFRVPRTFDELTTVGERFHLKPMLPLLTGDGRFYVLAVSLNKVRLLEGTRDSVYEIDLEDVPTSLAEALRFDDPEKSLQQYTISPAQGGGDRSDTAFHGTGAGEDDKKANVLRFFKELDNGVREMLGEDISRAVPLVFVGVDYLFPIYQEANHYKGLVEEAVGTNPDELSADELHDRAWSLVESHFGQRQEAARERFAQSAGSGSTSSSLQEIIPAAFDARIDTLFVAVGTQRWGRYDVDARSVELHDAQEIGDEDLLDLAAVQTLLNGGTVFAVPQDEVPGQDTLVAAIYRF